MGTNFEFKCYFIEDKFCEKRKILALLQEHLDIIRKTKNELAKVKLEWTETDQREASKFWTIDKRPLVRQTLYLVRHAEKLDIIDKSWGNDKNELEREDSPLSALGLRQADELGKCALVIIEIERRKRQRSANDRDFVMLQTIRHILQNNEKAENLVLVSHLSNIGLLLQRMGVEWVAMGQASITNLIRYEENIGNSPDLLQQFRMEFASEIGHLTERADYIFGV
ncbi:hypothetical protein niasHS_011400 [Heterodera schachtii]|uniref:Phosphoglycerate mutase n=1 Tax=Heterodera schachtii TaxID=97005 RepID=A0ABD2ILI9_HETSC